MGKSIVDIQNMGEQDFIVTYEGRFTKHRL